MPVRIQVVSHLAAFAALVVRIWLSIKQGCQYYQFCGSGPHGSASILFGWIYIRIHFGNSCGSGFGSMWAKMTHKKRKMWRNVLFWSAGCSLLRDRGFSCSLDVPCGSIGLHLWSKNVNCFSTVIFKKIASYRISGSGFWSTLTWNAVIWIRIHQGRSTTIIFLQYGSVF